MWLVCVCVKVRERAQKHTVGERTRSVDRQKIAFFAIPLGLGGGCVTRTSRARRFFGRALAAGRHIRHIFTVLRGGGGSPHCFPGSYVSMMGLLAPCDA